jgi:adsorption protein B
MDGTQWLAAFDFLLRETSLFAAVGFLVLGAGDLALDLIWIGRTLGRRQRVPHCGAGVTAADLPRAEHPGPIAIFVPAWDEAEVIGRMLGHTLASIDHRDFRLYVGCYPNDQATIGAVRTIDDPRLSLVLGPAPGPTTKADCLNHIWQAMMKDEEISGRRFKAAVLHDAEDVVHSAELRVFESLVERFDLVQLPVLPLIDPRSRWIAGHYADEFAEAHGKELVVREALGAGLPSAGVGCAIARGALDRLAEAHGTPFDSESLTEDYELGLRLHTIGGRSAFVRLSGAPGRPDVSVREYFPVTLSAAVGQKARWMRGIALSGWDRLGWSGGWAERWMRMRDRQSVLAALILAAGYLALLLWTLRGAGTLAGLAPSFHIPDFLRALLLANGGLLAWRLAMRAGFVARAYGWSEALRSVPRMVVANAIAMLAARQAVMRYAGQGTARRWDKTAHAFPSEVPAE